MNNENKNSLNVIVGWLKKKKEILYKIIFKLKLKN